MKRFAVAFTLLAALLVPSLAQSQVANGATRWVWESVGWRTQSTSFAALSYDSSMACGAAAARLDTTASINISGWQLFPKGTGSAVDSTLFAEVRVTDAYAGVTGAGSFDSLYFNIQVSDDGANWGLATPRSSGVIGFNTTTNPGGFVLDGFPANHFRISLENEYLAQLSLSSTASGALPDWKTLFGWQYIRFIVRSGAGTGCYSMRVGHWTAAN